MILASVSVTLLALAAGMFLLAKANKDNLGLFYKIVAYFIIISAALTLICSALYCAMKFHGQQYQHEMMMNKKHDKKMYKKHMTGGMDYYHKGKDYHRGGMDYHHGMMGKESSPHGWAKGCCEEACKSCYMMEMKKECIDMKDSASYKKDRKMIEKTK